ncbi:MAG: adenylate/guanylate cyclase domain-containing protein [Cyanobacteria bacterium P01_G01_bin.54]
MILGVRYLGLLQGLEWAAYDQFMRWRASGNEQIDERIKIVTIDEADLHAGGQGLISDRALAQALHTLAAQDPIVIGLDLYRDLPVPPGHPELSTALQDIPNIVGIQKVAEPVVAAPAMLDAVGRAKANDLVVDGDNRIRRGFLFLYNQSDQPIDAFAPYLALWFLEETAGMKFEKLSEDQWRFGAAMFKRFKAFDGGYIHAHTGGYQFLINYRGWGQQFEAIPFREVIANNLPLDWAKDQIVLIGATGESLNDYFFTPFSGSGFLETPVPLSGVEIHAHIIAQVLDAAQGDRPLLRAIPEILEILWIFLWSAIGAVIVWRWRLGVQIQSQQRSRRLWTQQLLWPLLLVATLVGSAYGALLWFSLLVPVVPAILSLGLAGIGVTIYNANKTAQLRQTFGRYLSNEVVTQLLERPGGLDLGGMNQKITILTSDIRGFTALSEQFTPTEVVTILNCHLKKMLRISTNYRGTINNIMGDGLLIFFGVPNPQPDDTKRAIACALAMQLAMEKVNQDLQAQGFPILEMGIGINMGECIVGNLGSELHTGYSAIGADVNLAFRIETYATGQQILVSEAVFEEVNHKQLRVDNIHQVSPKGVKGKILIYEIGGIGEPYNLELPKIEENFFPLVEPLELVYTPLDGKQVSEQCFKGQLVQLSAKGAKVLVEADESLPSPLTNLKLNLVNWKHSSEESDDIYAKVLHSDEGALLFKIRFTAIPPTIATFFSKIIA